MGVVGKVSVKEREGERERIFIAYNTHTQTNILSGQTSEQNQSFEWLVPSNFQEIVQIETHDVLFDTSFESLLDLKLLLQVSKLYLDHLLSSYSYLCLNPFD